MTTDGTSIGSGHASNVPQQPNAVTSVGQGQQPTMSVMFASSLDQSVAQAEGHEYDPKNPSLVKPTTYEIVLVTYNQKMSEITSAMLDGWIKSIQEDEDRRQAELKSPQYQAWLLTHSSNEIAKADAKKPEGLQIAIKDASSLESYITSLPIQQRDDFLRLDEKHAWESGLGAILNVHALNLNQSQGSLSADADKGHINLTRDVTAPDLAGYQPSAFMTSAIVISVGSMSMFQNTQNIMTPDIASTSQMDTKVIKDAWASVTPQNQNEVVVQQAGWLSAMWGIGLVYQLSAQSITQMASGTQKPAENSVKFAKSYAEAILQVVDENGDEFNAQIKALVTQNMEGSPEAKEEKTLELANEAKIVLLAVALALVMKTELGAEFQDLKYEGTVNGDEFAALLSGELSFGDEPSL